MKRSILLVSFCWLLSCEGWAQTPAPAKKPPVKSGAKVAPTPTPAPKAQTPGAITPDEKPQFSAAQLVEQGKALYQKANFPQALTKFEAALKVEPDRDDALFLAAETAYRLDTQPKARNWYLRRAELPNQKDTIKAFSFYRAATTYWREAHDAVAAYATFKDGGTVMSKLPEKGPVTAASVDELIASGLHLIDRCIALTPRYAEAHNIKNLLYAEAAWLKSGTVKGEEAQEKAQASLREAIALMKGREAKTVPTDFGAPTLRVGEFPPTNADDPHLVPSPIDGLKGGVVVKRFAAIFPTSVPRSADSGDDNPDRGGRKGALTAATTPGKVKVEVLISPTGDVTFAHIVQGRSDLNGAAIAAARKWKFMPAKFEDHPIQLSGVITFDMRPGGSRATPTPTPAPKP